MDTVTLKINNVPITVPANYTILQAAKEAGIDIPTLCYLKDINEIGACRICVVEVKGARTLVASCVQPVSEGMEIITNTPRVFEARKQNLELVLSNHDKKCLSCVRSQNCELQKLSKDYGIADESKYDGESPKFEVDNSALHMVRDNNKCILCRRCVAACSQNQGVGVIGANDRGFETHIACAFEQDLADVSCIGCGQCINVCPTGALYERDCSEKSWNAIMDPNKHVIVQTAPAVRAAIGEEFGLPIGTNCEGKMVTALRKLGFDAVFDTVFAADLTIMEEAHEFLDRFTNGGALPMLTSCSPGWVNYLEHYFPEFIPNLSSCKSPQQMFGAIAKSYYAEKMGLDPKDIYLVSVMPCTAKKYEMHRDDQDANGVPDVDSVITTREFARMVHRAGLDFVNLEDGEFDAPLGISTGAGLIFGASGGVMEAALRTAVETLTGEELEKLDFTEVRGMEGIKEATYNVNGIDVKVAACSGTANAGKLLQKIRNGEAEYHFIEVMACPGGCINGGGQPIQPASVRNFVDIKAKRASVLYQGDKDMKVRKSHENPAIKELYETYLEKPGSHRAHELLHTTYTARPLYAIPAIPAMKK